MVPNVPNSIKLLKLRSTIYSVYLKQFFILIFTKKIIFHNISSLISREKAPKFENIPRFSQEDTYPIPILFMFFSFVINKYKIYTTCIVYQ